jgi:hypothetical protein
MAGVEDVDFGRGDVAAIKPPSILPARIVAGIVVFESERPMALTWATCSPDFAQWKRHVSPGRTTRLRGG